MAHVLCVKAAANDPALAITDAVMRVCRVRRSPNIYRRTVTGLPLL